MKIDRAEVERLAKIAARAERDQVAVRVDPGKLAELCRLALEVMDAPVIPVSTLPTPPPNKSVLDIDWPDFITTYCKMLPCDKDGRLVRVGEDT